MPDRRDSYFDADLPIEDRTSDRLGRRKFAESIASQILDVPVEHGFTVAITGEWGSGKTSVLNMVAEAIADGDGEEAEGDEKVSVIHFNPWLFGGSTELVSRFFAELSAQLGQRDLDQLKAVAQVLTDMGRTLAQHSSMPGAGPAAAILSLIVGKWVKQPSLLLQRKRLREALLRLPSRIVVVVDDIDRLERSEIRELFRSIRLTSDLPNVVCLLAFDRQHVAKSLGASQADGQEYLEKIVQVSYSLPVVRESVLQENYLPIIDELIKRRGLDGPNTEAWQQVHYDIIGPLLRNLRDVKRYVYALPATLDTIGNEVELADLLGLEAIKVLKPTIFEELKSHPDYLVRVKSDLRMMVDPTSRRSEIQSELKCMLERARGDRGLLESVFQILFPATQEHLEGPPPSPNLDSTWRRERRVACEEVYRIYLSGGLDDLTVPADDIRDLLSVMTDRSRVGPLLESLDPRALEQILEQLEDYESEFTDEAAPVVVPILANLMGSLNDEFTGGLDFTPRFKARRIIYRLLRRIQDQNALGIQLGDMLSEVNSLSGKLCLIEIVGHREHVGHGMAAQSRAIELENDLLDSLTAAAPDELGSEWDLIGLSLRPIKWFEDDRKSRLALQFADHLKRDQFVLALLRSGASFAFSSGRVRQKRLPWETLVESFGEGLAEAVSRLPDSQLYCGLPEDDKETVQLALLYAGGGQPTEWESIP